MSQFRPVSPSLGEPSQYFIGPAYTGADVRAFILPTYSAHYSVFNLDGVSAVSKFYEEEGGTLQSLLQSESATKKYYMLRGLNPPFSAAAKLFGDHMTQILGNSIQRSMIPNIAGVSLSTHRDKVPVYSLGSMGPRGFVGSRRTTAGTLVFWMGDTSPISELLSPMFKSKLLHADEIPPFDLYLTFMNDQGAWSSCVVQGITVLDEGTVIEMSNPDGIVVTYSYMAMSSTPVMPGYFSIIPAADQYDFEGIDGVTVDGTMRR